jgi:hypothetical protein
MPPSSFPPNPTDAPPLIRPIISQEMHTELLLALQTSPNESADDVLLEGMSVGSELEKSIILTTLLARKSVRGLSGVIELFDTFSEKMQLVVLGKIGIFHSALRECGRSERAELRVAAMKLIALARQGKMAYVLSENLHAPQEALNKAAAEGMVAMARWVATTARKLQREYQLPVAALDDSIAKGQEAPIDWPALYRDLMEQRPEIETAVARATDVHRGDHGQELLRAALLLCDWPQSKTLSILHTSKHGGQNLMVRRLQQVPTSEHVEAFLLGATHGQLRLHFGSVMSNIEEAPTLDALLRRTHWTKDNSLQLCMHQVTRGVWWQEGELQRDMSRRDADDACRIGEWLAVSGAHDVVQDERMIRIAEYASDSVSGRLRLLRIAIRRKRSGSTRLIRVLLRDGDERLARMAAREMIRRRPADYENVLLQLMTQAPESVRRVISRSLGHVGFEQYWQRFDQLDRVTRRQAGKAMLKLVTDAPQRLNRRLTSGTVEQRLKALQVTQALGLADVLGDAVASLSTHPNPKVRSKAVNVLAETPGPVVDTIMERVLNDNDPRVRANAVEVLETKKSPQFLPMLAQRAKASPNRERANAIKALNAMKVGNLSPQLIAMLQDPRPEHRISAMWALKQMGFWNLLQAVGDIAKSDQNPKARRYALSVLKNVATMAENSQKAG